VPYLNYMANNTRDEVIDRLIAENSNSNKMINEAKFELFQFGDIDGMSFIAAVRTLVKKFKDLVSENTKLKEENKTLKKSLDKFTKA